MTSRSQTIGALRGVVAGVAGVSAALLAGALLGQRTTILTAVAEAVRDLTPGPLAESLIRLVGHLDKPLLLAGVIVGALACAAFAGTRRWGVAVFVVLGALAAAAALTRPGATEAAAIPVFVGAGTAIVVLGALLRYVPIDDADGGARRKFLVLGGLLAASALVGGAASWAGRARRGVEAARARLGRTSAGVVPVGADLAVAGLGPWRVSNDDFYRIDTALSLPSVKPDDWRLRIHGMVNRELTLTYDDLLARERTEAWLTIACVSNPVGGDLIGNAFWSGVRIAPLLAEAGIRPSADAVLQTSADGWTCGTPLSVLTDDRNAILALAMNGEPLPVEHGFPVRTIVPGLYGFVSATKWVTDFEVSRFDRFTAFWTSRGWSEQAPVRTQSRIDVPREHAKAGRVQVAGTAWAQHVGIERVEVRVDDGPWVRCTLGRVPSSDTWVQWSAMVDCARGNRLLTVRATDRTGATQPKELSSAAPNGATGWHQVWISVD